MDTEKIKTLQHVDEALRMVENARADQSLSPNEKFELERMAVKLRNIERSIIRLVQQELVDSLTADSASLAQLSVEIKNSSDKLAGIAVGVEKAAKVVEAFISIIATAATAGLL